MFATSIKDSLELHKIFTKHSSPLSMNATCIYLLFYISVQVLVSTPVPDSTEMNVCLWQLFLNQPQCPETSTNRLIRFNLKNLIHYLRLYVDKKKSKQTNASNPWKQQLLLFVKFPPHISTSLQKISVHSSSFQLPAFTVVKVWLVLHDPLVHMTDIHVDWPCTACFTTSSGPEILTARACLSVSLLKYKKLS